MQGSEGTQGKRMRRSASIAVVAALPLLAAACSAGGQSAQSTQNAAKAKAAAAAADLKITPVNGAGDADPSAGITVTAVHGTLKNVAVHTASGSVTGSLSQGGKVWHSQWALGTGTSYQVTATASEGHSGTVTQASSFRTLTPGPGSVPASVRSVERWAMIPSDWASTRSAASRSRVPSATGAS